MDYNFNSSGLSDYFPQQVSYPTNFGLPQADLFSQALHMPTNVNLSRGMHDSSVYLNSLNSGLNSGSAAFTQYLQNNFWTHFDSSLVSEQHNQMLQIFQNQGLSLWNPNLMQQNMRGTISNSHILLYSIEGTSLNYSS